MAHTSVWISYDLGIRGDYQGLYAWLDSHKAKECGDSVALLKFQHTGPLHERLKAELKTKLETDKRTRIYVIYQDANNRVVGRFLFGGRRSGAWTGYAPSQSDTVDE